MKKTDEFLVNRLIWKAKKYNLPTNYSFFYNELSPDVQKYLNIYVEEFDTGQPVLFFTSPSNKWTLVCSRKIICNDNIGVFKISIQDIQELKPPVLGNVSSNKLVDLKESKKSEWHQITVVDKERNSYILHADKGKDFFALWNILLMAIRLYD